MTIFEDGFESGDFSAWATPIGSPTVQYSTNSPSGLYFAIVPKDSRVYKVFTDKDIVYARVYVKWASNPSIGNQAYLFNLGAGDGTGTLVYVRIENDGGTPKYGLRTKNDSGVFVDDFCESGPTPTSTVWHCIEVKWQKNTLKGAKLIVDGLYAGCTTATTYDNQADTLNLQLEQTEVTAYYDCAVVSEGYVGPFDQDFVVNNNLTVGNTLTMKNPENEKCVDLRTILLGDPILNINEGVTVKKDVGCLGAFMSGSPTILQFDDDGYTPCVRSDIGKPVKLDNDYLPVGDQAEPYTLLLYYDNQARQWWLNRPHLIPVGSAMSLDGGVGAGTTEEYGGAHGACVTSGGGAVQLGHGFEWKTDPPRINLTDWVDPADPESGKYDTLCLTAGVTYDRVAEQYLGVDDVLANMKLKSLYAKDLNPVPGQDWIDIKTKLRINGDLQLVDGHVASSLNPADSGFGLGSGDEPWDGIVAVNGYFDTIHGLLNVDQLSSGNEGDVLTIVNGVPTWAPSNLTRRTVSASSEYAFPTPQNKTVSASSEYAFPTPQNKTVQPSTVLLQESFTGWNLVVDMNVVDASVGQTTPWGLVNVPSGNSQQVSAPATYFSGWTLDGSDQGSANPITVPAQTDGSVHRLVAVFGWLAQASSGAYGSISPSGNVVVAPNSSKQFTATPDDGYSVSQWLLDGDLVQSGGSTYTAPAQQTGTTHTVHVTFT